MSETSVKIWLPWFPADYLRDTITFTLEEDAVYRRALDFLWQNPEGIPKETRRLCLALRIQPDELARTIWVLEKFMSIRGDFYFNEKLEEHRQKAIRNRQTQRENGLKGGRPEKPKITHGLAESKADENPSNKQNESPSTSPSPSSLTSTPSPKNSNYVAGATENEKLEFEKARKMYPGSKNGLDTEFQNFKKKHKDWVSVIPLLVPAINDGIEHREWLLKCKQNDPKVFIAQWKNFKTWINGRCWEEEFPTEIIT